ncbi:MAG: argininosuccinate lyase [Spirochaetota bacterium]
MRGKRVLMIAALLVVFAVAAFAANPVLDFKLINKTGVDIHELYVSAANVDSWEEDVLGVDILSDGDSVEITFPGKVKATKFDLKIVDEDQNELEWYDLPLDEINELTLVVKGSKATATWK